MVVSLAWAVTNRAHSSYERSGGDERSPDAPPPIVYDPPMEPLEVIAEGERWVAINKPSGLLSVPGRGEDKSDCARTRVEEIYPDATGPMSVHRLDLETSGVLLLALDPTSHKALSVQFMNREVEKKYVAVLDGNPTGDQGVVELPLIVDWPMRPMKTVDHENGKHATTAWRVLERFEDGFGPRTRVEFTPITGRSHQLRVHAAWAVAEGGMGCPIAGDTLYGNAASAPRLLLHATFLRFFEPDSPDRIDVESAPPF